MDNAINLIKFNEQILLNLQNNNDRIYKVILALECVLDFENFKDFDGIKFCKYTSISFDELESYLNILINENIILEKTTDSMFSTTYKLNFESIDKTPTDAF